MSDQLALDVSSSEALRPWQRSVGASHQPGTDTEIAAARMVAPRIGTLKAGVLAHLRERSHRSADQDEGATMYELAEAVGALLYSVGPRITELRRAGWVQDSGRRRKTPNDADAIVWVLSARGREELGLGGAA